MFFQRNKYLLLLCSLQLQIIASAQSIPEPKVNYEVGVNYLQGFIMKHDKYMGHLSKGITRGAEISIARKSDGRNAWQRLTNFPDVGAVLSYFEYPTPVLGRSIALTSFSDYYLIRAGKLQSTLGLGIGLAYHSNPYHKERNNKNVVYGSLVTFSLQSRLALKYELVENWYINGSAGVTHFSFADIKRPNKGLNTLAVSIGVKHIVASEKTILPEPGPEGPARRKLRYSLNFNAAPVNYKVIDTKLYPMFSFSAHVQKPVSQLFDVQLGIDLFNNYAMVEVIKDDTRVNASTLPDHKRAGVSSGIEYHMNKISIQFNIGYYLYAPYTGAFGNLYQRYGLKFYVNDNVYINTGFKSHRADAENAEFGLGYRF